MGTISAAYIAAAIFFILSLSGLSNQETSKRGNWYGIIGKGQRSRCLQIWYQAKLPFNKFGSATSFEQFSWTRQLILRPHPCDKLD
jgi:hypothetical protein